MMTSAADMRERYTKYEFRVPMRDGVRLFTSVLVPKDTSTSYPILLTRSPFGVGPYGPDEYFEVSLQTQALLAAGYILVRQDVRGRLMSEGSFVHVRPHTSSVSATDVDEATDTWDTVEWLLHHLPNHNGRVGIWGVSYGGFFTLTGIIDTHPAIKAASPQAPVADLFLDDDWYHGGAFMLVHAFGAGWAYKAQEGPTLPPKVDVPFDYGTHDGYEFFLNAGPIANLGPMLGDAPNPTWQELLDHPTYDAFWQERAIWRRLKEIRCPVLVVGGWFDAEDLAGPLRVHRSIREHNPGVATTLVMGPWTHGGWAIHAGHRLGSVDFASDTAVYYREHILVPFFEHHLKDAGAWTLPEAYVFETGTNQWRGYEAWPPPEVQARTLYFRTGGGLSLDPPPEADDAARDSYVSDPAKPVPFVGYTTMGMAEEYMASDQRFAASRPDVLVYATEPLEEDLAIAGPVSPHLFVSTTGTDADWVVKLIDVYPPEMRGPVSVAQPDDDADVGPPGSTLAGYQQLVRGWPFRGKFRRSMESPEPFEPGVVEEVRFSMPDVNHVFRRGHRVMVQVQSTWFPLIDRNPQTFVNIPTATAEDFQVATQTVVRSADQPSGVEIRVLQGRE